ncbi:MAG: N-acetylmuramoyl-L-alanine amidase [Desulfovibrio sp.]|uniref:N-acetylmuramoyl-L-alanine amidase n=1 Tax=Desulfovibrio sp. 7SRBS1 TaxID=3378064 RepID=UPI003B40873A
MTSRRNILAALAAAGLLTMTSPAGALCAEQPSAFDLALKGQDLLSSGQVAQAVEILTKAATMDPRNEWVWGLLGRASFQAGDMRTALDSFRNALRLNPNDTYSQMMADMISQRPVPPRSAPTKPLSELEKQAQEEEKQFTRKYSKGSALGYQVRRVVLDAGHGGFDPGAVGPNKIEEKNITLDLAQRTARILEQMAPDAKYFLSRTADYYMPLSARTTFANQFRADLFVSFHINANANPKPKGVETYFCSEKASSKEAERVASYENSVLKFDKGDLTRKGYVDIEDILFRFERRRYWDAGGKAAKALQKGMAKQLPMRDRGVHSANFYVLRRAQMPSILLETGFISNLDNEKFLMSPDNRHKVAQSIAAGILGLQKQGV